MYQRCYSIIKIQHSKYKWSHYKPNVWSGWLLFRANPSKPGEQEWLGELSVVFDIISNYNSIELRAG